MNFSKYNACGSDYVIIEAREHAQCNKLARVLCDRRDGVGANGLIVVVTRLARAEGIGFSWEYYNPDGSTNAFNANAAMVACMYAYEHFLAGKNVKFISDESTINGEICGFDIGRSVSLGGKKRDSNFGQIYGMGSNRATTANVEVKLPVPKRLGEGFMAHDHMWYFYDTGMPHLVTFVNKASEFNLVNARELSEKMNANVNYVELSGNSLKVRTYLADMDGEALACGTGVAAAFVASMHYHNLPQTAQATLASGERMGVRAGDDGAIYVRGDVRHLFDGDYIA